MSLRGSFWPPGDKSISHRLALMSLLAEGRCELSNFSPCQDVNSSLEAIRLLGGRVLQNNDDLVIRGSAGVLSHEAKIDCGNSGTTMRLLMGILAGQAGEYVLDGDESLRRRPMERVAKPLRLMGAEIECLDGRCPVTVRGGGLKGLEFQLSAASAQLKSAVLLAGLQAKGRTRVREPQLSRDHTERLITLMGGTISRLDDGWRVEPSELTLPESFFVPGDASSAAFFLCAAAIVPGSQVTAEGMLLNPTRIGFLRVLQKMGARVEIEKKGESPEPWGRVTVGYAPDLNACEVSAAEIPSLVDEVPILALTATQAAETTVFRGVSELRLKETDRLAAISGQLARLGARVTIDGESLIVEGRQALKNPAKLDSFGDHRIAMTLRLAGLLTGGEPFIADESCVSVSYPDFHQDLKRLRR